MRVVFDHFIQPITFAYKNPNKWALALTALMMRASHALAQTFDGNMTDYENGTYIGNVTDVGNMTVMNATMKPKVCCNRGQSSGSSYSTNRSSSSGGVGFFAWLPTFMMLAVCIILASRRSQQQQSAQNPPPPPAAPDLPPPNLPAEPVVQNETEMRSIRVDSAENTPNSEVIERRLEERASPS